MILFKLWDYLVGFTIGLPIGLWIFWDILWM